MRLSGEKEGRTKRALRRHWTTSGGRDWEVVPKAEGVDLEKRREVMTSDGGLVMDERKSAGSLSEI